MKKGLFILLLCISHNIFSQEVSNKVLQEYEDTLSTIAYTIMNGENEKVRQEANKGFISELLAVLKYNNSYSFPFDSLKTISILQPNDKSFRIFNWILRKDNGSYQYFGYIVIPKPKTNTIIQLTDNDDFYPNFSDKILNNNNWYGALYYKIISQKKKENKHYTLLGWDGNNPKSTKKIIDILEIKEDTAWFGKNIFINGKETTSRVVIEYNSRTSVSVNYDDTKNRIVFDHLVPLKEQQKGFKAFYVPDGSYDCYHYKNGKWLLKLDVDARTEVKTKKENKGLFKP